MDARPSPCPTLTDPGQGNETRQGEAHQHPGAPETEIELGDGVTGIIRTNAAGKSTILESLEWAIFGGRPVRGSVKVLKWYNAPPRSGIRVDWGIELGGGEGPQGHPHRHRGEGLHRR